MSVWSAVFLGVIALATVTMAVIQVGVIVAAGRMARRVERLADHVEHELKPLFDHLDAIGRDASKATGLAVAQVERADRLFTDAAHRVEEALALLPSVLAGPAREGRAVVLGFRAALDVLRDLRFGRAGSRRSEDDDALFI